MVSGASFPMEMDRFPGKVWVVSHKPVAVAAGLGHMGIHRLVIHPKFGNFIALGTILIDDFCSARFVLMRTLNCFKHLVNVFLRELQLLKQVKTATIAPAWSGHSG